MLNENELQKMFYRPICSWEEIERIFNVQNACDHLLKLRADTIVDNMRLFRVYRNKALMNEPNWTLESSFETTHFEKFLSRLPKIERDKCQAIFYGNIFSTDPNGLIFRTNYGPIITVCDSLRFFLKFMHLGILNFNSNVPNQIRLNSLRIGIRVMLKTETLDFLMDPRGIIPQEVAIGIHKYIPNQLEFIAGHEFSHYILGHLSESNIISRSLIPPDFDGKPLKSFPVYGKTHSQEIEADIQSILLPHRTFKKKREILEAALLFLASLDLYESVYNCINPPIPWLKTHPSARDRYNNLLSECASFTKLNPKKWEDLTSTIDAWKELLISDISMNEELYESYGSVYLDKPNSEWRGKELIDRVDYY